jgi:integrase/recombinase XerD
MHIPSTSSVSAKQIGATAERWARKQYHRGRAHTFKWPREHFLRVAIDWLRFLGRLDEPAQEPPSFVNLIEQFSEWMNVERGLSPVTISNYYRHVKQFLQWCQDHNRSAVRIQASDVDAFLGSLNEKGWCRVSIASCAKALKAFLVYAGQCGWCHPTIASAVQGPRLFSQDGLPSGPSWNEVNRIIDCLMTDQSRNVRDYAIILLFAIYGLRSGEVAKLRIDDIDWRANRLFVCRSKQRRSQTPTL